MENTSTQTDTRVHRNKLSKRPEQKWQLEPKWLRSVVEWLYCSDRIIIVRWADLCDFFSLIFVGKMCVFVPRPMKIVTFLRKKADLQKRLVDFPVERDTFRNQILEIVEDFASESNCFHFSFFFHHFSPFFRFFSFFHFFTFFTFFPCILPGVDRLLAS